MGTDAARAHVHATEVDDPVVLRALAGDAAAEREVCRRLLPAIRAFARRRLAPSWAEDFTQDVLVTLLEAMRERRIEEPSRVAAFALGICRNLAREGARSTERRRELLGRYGLCDAELVALATPLYVRRELLEDCYSQLTERSRRVLRESFCETSADAEIAESMAISEQNVRVIRHRTLAALRKCLEGPISWVQR